MPRPPAFSMLRRPVAWIYLALVVAGLFVVVPRLVSVPAVPAIAAVALAGCLIQAAVMLFVGWLLLPKRRAAASTVLVSALIGATFCAGAAILLNRAVVGMELEILFLAPVNEEFVKLAAIALVLFALRHRMRGPLDGLVVGFFVGFGFAVVENILYSYSAGSVVEAWQLVIARAITSPGTHGVFAGIAGAGLAYLIVSRERIVSRGRAWGLAVAAFGLALGLHLLWDAVRLWVPSLVYLGLVIVIYAAGIVAFVVTRRLSAAYEARSGAVDDSPAGAAFLAAQAPGLQGAQAAEHEAAEGDGHGDLPPGVASDEIREQHHQS